MSRGLGRVPRGVWIVVAVLALIVYHDAIPSWVWTFVVGVLVVWAVFKVLSRGRR